MENRMKRRTVNKGGLTLPGSTPIDVPIRHRSSVDSSVSSMDFSPPDSPQSLPAGTMSSVGTQTPTDSCFSFDYPSVTDDNDGTHVVYEEKQIKSTVATPTERKWFPFSGWMRRSSMNKTNPDEMQEMEGSKLLDDAEAERLSSSLEGVGRTLRMIADDFDRTRACRGRSNSLVWDKF